MSIHVISRRSFLQGVAGTGAGLLLSGEVRPADPAAERVCWALVADTHINASPDAAERGGKMSERLRRVVRDLLSVKDRPVGMIVNGDIAHQKGRHEAYANFLELIAPVRRAGIDLHLTLGNHDDRSNFLATVHARLRPASAPAGASRPANAVRKSAQAAPLAGRHVTVIDSGPVRSVLLDSLIRPDLIHGQLGPEQLQWLARTLDAKRQTPTLLFLHHNLDAGAGLQDAQALLEVIRPRRQVKAVFEGHNHVYAFRERDGIHLVKLPATGYAFSPDQPIGWVRAWFDARGCELELRAVDGDRTRHGQKRVLRWRAR